MTRHTHRSCVVPRSAGLLLVSAPVLLASCESPEVRADITYYGDHVPALNNDATPFTNPFMSRASSTDPTTTGLLRAVPGLRHPRGAVSWGVAAWAKYVLLGNYDEGGSSIGQFIDDQRMGVYDSEQKKFCQIDLNSLDATNASVQWISVADPRARTTRIFYEGLANNTADATHTGPGYVFGFVKGNLDAQDPCHATSGWLSGAHGYLPADLNAKAREANLPDDPCPDPDSTKPEDDFCGWDGMTVLRHDSATNTDTVLLNNWINSRIVIAEIDGNDELRIRAVHTLPFWQPDGSCYSLHPVSKPDVNPTDPPNDLRFLQAFDKICAPTGEPGNAPGCAAQSVCPLSLTSCQSSCNQAYCTRTLPFFGNYVAPPPASGRCGAQSCRNYPLPFTDACVDLGPPTNACLRLNPHAVLTPVGDGSTHADCPAPPTPVREYRYNAATKQLTSLSHFFQSETDEGLGTLGASYSKTGSVFFTASVHVVNNPADPNDDRWHARVIRYARNVDGLRAYDEAAPVSLSDGSNSIKTTTDAEDYPLPDHSLGWLNLPLSSVESGTAMYLFAKDKVQRDQFNGLVNPPRWQRDTAYKLAFGVGAAGALPHETFTCADATTRACPANGDCGSGHECFRGFCRPKDALTCEGDSECPSGQLCAKLRCARRLGEASQRPCVASADCPTGETCTNAGGTGEDFPKNAVLGGAPPSLWLSPHASDPPGQRSHVNAYLYRVPLGVELPGATTSNVAPALAWSTKPSCAGKCDRVWLFAAPQGALSYRTRDQGLWAPSFSPLPTNETLAGGPAATFSASTTSLGDASVEVFARRQSDGRLLGTKLDSGLECTPGNCQWLNWQVVPNSPITDIEPAATIALVQNAGVVFVSVKDMSGLLWVAQRSPSSGWSAWRSVPGLATDAAPSLVFKADDGQVWLFARDRQNGAIRYARVDVTPGGSWNTAGNGGERLPWSTGPSASYTGIVRVLVGKGTFPANTYQTTFAGGAWDAWQPLASGAGTTRAPASTVVNGDLNVVLTYVTTMAEHHVK